MKSLYKLFKTYAVGLFGRVLKSASQAAITVMLAICGFLVLVAPTTVYAEDSGSVQAKAQDLVCTGEFTNPISGMCWSCVMPIGISSIFYKGGQDGTKDLTGWEQYLCTCDLYIGVPISFYEPARVIDVTTKPYCMVALGGISFADTGTFTGDTAGFAGMEGDQQHNYTFFQAHYYINPVMYVLSMILDNSKCFEQSGFDVGYLTEVDPSWLLPEYANLLSPDGFLYGNLPAIAACVGDCAAATNEFSVAALHWCVGCSGLNYPMTGHIDNPQSTIDSASVVVQRLLTKLHRQGINMSYYGNDGLCGGYRQLLMNKRQYKYSMTFPVSQTKSVAKAMSQAISGTNSAVTDTGGSSNGVADGSSTASVAGGNTKQCCQPLGRTTMIWGTGRYYPIEGEDMSFQIYRKRDCCQKVYGWD